MTSTVDRNCRPEVANDFSHRVVDILSHFYPEIIHPDTLEPLPDGEQGELVFTTLTRTGTPMLRYRTRDLSRIHAEPCACGRTIRTIERIQARSDDMLIIRGVNVFPSQIEAALLSIESYNHICDCGQADADSIPRGQG